MAKLFCKNQFKQWLISKGYTANTADQYGTYIGHLFRDRVLNPADINNMRSALAAYTEFLKECF